MTESDKPADGHEIEIISDGDGVALIGDPMVIEAFLVTHKLPSREFSLDRIARHAGTASTATGIAAKASAESARWIKLTEQSTKILREGTAMSGSASGVSRGIVMTGGKTSHILQYSNKGFGLLSNPALLTGAAGIMAQFAMQQAMEEITDYLKVIDAKVDAVMRAQKDAVFADMVGVEMSIEEALAIRGDVGRVSEVTWSKVQAAPATITRTQAYALRQIGGYADRLEAAKTTKALADDAKSAAQEVNEWLGVVARCVQLHDAAAILELDRVMDAAPAELDEHRQALRAARTKRIEFISAATIRLREQVEAAAGTANAKVLLHPASSRSVINSATRISGALIDFDAALGIAKEQESIAGRRWLEAAADVRDKTLEVAAEARGKTFEAGTAGVEGALRLSASSIERARDTAGALSSKLGALKRRDNEDG